MKKIFSKKLILQIQEQLEEIDNYKKNYRPA